MNKLDIVNELRAESETDCVAYTQFMLSFKKNDEKIYAFFEGYEDRYYYPIRIETILGNKEIIDFICGGKDNVLKVHSLIKGSKVYKSCTSFFFIDSDFDSNNHHNTIYVTPTYSLENLYVTPKTVEKILISEFKFLRNSDDIIKCISIYNTLIDKFITDIDKLNIWLACQSQIRNDQNISTRLNIDKYLKDIFSKSIICEDLNNYINIESISTKEKIENIFADAPNITNELYNNKENEFKNIDKLLKYRGKFLLKFLEIFLFRLQSLNYTKYNKIFQNKYSSNLRIEYNTMCSNLTQYAETPDCLRNYLTNYN
ncbi:TPA: DUF4435 domain-containing protein [Elizabethkingia anophelis]|nr:DUF4435 domain-containing protein [Elizabethkingia anophelis]MCT4211130.1 DUF4435 domain-containing protein [Elizabethkingia anophelis]